MTTTIDIEREIMRFYKSDISRKDPPNATIPDLERACLALCDKVDKWLESEDLVREDVERMVYLMKIDAPRSELDAMAARLKFTPDKTRSWAMLDTTQVTDAIMRLISRGTTEEAILIAVAHRFPNITKAELSQALQDATAAAEKRPRGGTDGQQEARTRGEVAT
jgi:hypothetical protein